MQEEDGSVTDTATNEETETQKEPVSEQVEAVDAVDEAEEAQISQLRANLNLDSETALIETVLFLESEPQNTTVLSKISQLSEEVVSECISRLKDKYANADSGIELSQIVGGWLLTPKKECFDLVKERYGKKNEGRLSKAAIETLSIIAYSQPITRAEIESIRHVNADNMIRILLDRKFIREAGKKDVPGKPIMYATTKEFLEFFHLQSIADLPQLDEKESERFVLAR
jgi:segregation and condensation protein B